MKTFAAIAAFLAGCASTAFAQAPRPTLIVAISVDQFSADLFAEYRQHYTAGLKRLADGIVFPAGFQSHAATETCPGHSTILTGSHPARTGIIANDWFDLSVDRPGKEPHHVYCAEDETRPNSSFTDYAVSPIHLKVPTLGDRMKKADPRSRVVAVSGKDRAAVMMGGHATDAIWYLDPKGLRRFVTLPDRDGAEPAVVQRVNAALPALIDRPAMPKLPAQCVSRSAGVKTLPDGPVVGILGAVPKGSFRATPDFDRVTADIAIGLLETMKLGHGPAPDLLAISLSANDYIGHYYGTEGAEMCAQQVALDQTIGRILAALDANGSRYVVVLTADHGGIDIPERNRLRGAPDAQRIDAALDHVALSRQIVAEFKLDIDPKRLWVGGIPGDLWLDRAVPAALRPQIVAAMQAKIMAFPQVAAVLTAADLARQAAPRPPVDDWSLIEKARASFDPARSGDLLVMLKPRVVPVASPKAGAAVTTHGSPWNYDRRVPMLFWYGGATPHEDPLSVETVDILPTLAPLIGLAVPAAEIDGRCIDLDPGPVDTCRLPRQSCQALSGQALSGQAPSGRSPVRSGAPCRARSVRSTRAPRRLGRTPGCRARTSRDRPDRRRPSPAGRPRRAPASGRPSSSARAHRHSWRSR